MQEWTTLLNYNPNFDRMRLK